VRRQLHRRRDKRARQAVGRVKRHLKHRLARGRALHQERVRAAAGRRRSPAARLRTCGAALPTARSTADVSTSGTSTSDLTSTLSTTASARMPSRGTRATISNGALNVTVRCERRLNTSPELFTSVQLTCEACACTAESTSAAG
jgi:hypothetical protein